MTKPDWFDRSRPPSETPVRRAGSIRRTTSMELHWPQGHAHDAYIVGRGRDLLTSHDGVAQVVADERLDAVVTPEKIVASLSTDPVLHGTQALAGAHALRGFRGRLRQMAQTSGPLTLLLDDMVGINIISGWVWIHWHANRAEGRTIIGEPAAMLNACLSYQPGSGALEDVTHLDKLNLVPPLGRHDDPLAFHLLRPDCDRTLRRVRRIDVWRERGIVRLDAMFQDSGVLPGSLRSAIHEYRLRASADAASSKILSIDAQAGTLPHVQCHAGPETLNALPGVKLPDLRSHVLRELRGPAGCTHLNDAARSLAEMGTLAACLDHA